jgi:hypothetical protein
MGESNLPNVISNVYAITNEGEKYKIKLLCNQNLAVNMHFPPIIRFDCSSNRQRRKGRAFCHTQAFCRRRNTVSVEKLSRRIEEKRCEIMKNICFNSFERRLRFC